MHRHSLSALAGAALLTACGEAPPVDEGLAPPLTSVISGDVVVTVPLAEPHNVVIFLQKVLFDDAGNPTDPAGYPLVNLAVVPADALAEGGSPPVRTGRYTLSRVPAGIYIATGIVDADDNFFPGTATPVTAGDLVGGYFDIATGSLAFAVEAGESLDEINLTFSTSP